MISFDFDYYHPDTLKEAVETHMQLSAEGKNAVYYSGGSEIITMCRAESIRPDAVIDIKSIPECTVLALDAQALHIGAACTLSQIKESRIFPLLGLASGRIADHTNQCRITLGGNLCGTIIYRETSLPLMLSDAQITLQSAAEARTVPFQSVFQERMQLKPGELVVQIHVPLWALQARHAHIKKTANEKIDYPLVSIAAIWQNNDLRTAFSGIRLYPFRSVQVEAVLNDRQASCGVRAQKAAALLSESAHGDLEGSAGYKTFVLKNMLFRLLEDWENGKL